MMAHEAAEHRPMLEVLRNAPRPVWVLIAGTFVNRIGSYFSTFVVLFLAERGFGASVLPFVLGAIGVSAIAGSLVGGRLADAVGRKRALVASMVASAIALAVLSLATGQVAIVLAVCAVAACTQSYLPSAAALLVDHSAPVDRVALFALFRVALNLGAALGPLLAALATTSYDILFIADSATCALFAVLLIAGLSTDVPARAKPAVAGDDAGLGAAAGAGRRGLRAILSRGDRTPRTPAVVALCVAISGVTLIYSQHTSTLPLQLTADGMSASFYGLLLACNGFLVVVFELPLASLTRRFTPHRPMIAGALMMSVGMALSGLLPGAVAVLAAVALWSLGEMVLTPVVSSAIAALSAPDRIARDQALLSSAQTAGFCLGPVVGVAAFNGVHVLPWIGCLAIGAGVASLIALSHRLASAPKRSLDPLPAATAASTPTPSVAHV